MPAIIIGVPYVQMQLTAALRRDQHEPSSRQGGNWQVCSGLGPVIRLVAPQPARSSFACRAAASPV